MSAWRENIERVREALGCAEYALMTGSRENITEALVLVRGALEIVSNGALTAQAETLPWREMVERVRKALRDHQNVFVVKAEAEAALDVLTAQIEELERHRGETQREWDMHYQELQRAIQVREICAEAAEQRVKELAGERDALRLGAPVWNATRELPCGSCGRDNPVWWVADDIWNRAVGTPENPRGEGIILCPTCFVRALLTKERIQ